MKSIIFILLFLFLSSNTYSQKEYYNWFFGRNAAITFDTPDKIPVNFDNYWMTNTRENSSVVSNPKGDLQFASYANIVFSNRMKLRGEHTEGHTSSSQGGVLFKIDGDKYMHVSSSFARDDNRSSQKLGYSILNFSIKEYKIYIPQTEKYYTYYDKGIVSNYKNIRTDYNSEKLLLVKNKCGSSVYIITHDYNTNQYRLYWFDLKEEKFILKHSIDSKFEKQIEDSQLKFNKVNSTFINFSRKHYEVIKLNCSTEKLEFVRYEPFEYQNDGLSGEFSPNGKYYYFLNSDGIYVLKGMDKVETKLPSYELLFPDIAIHRQNDLLMGPDSIIYISNQNHQNLLTLKNTDDLEEVELIRDAIILDGTSMIGLPNIPTTMYDYTIDSLLRICEGKDFRLELDVDWYFENPSFSWTGTNGFSSNERVVNIENATQADAGTYHLKVSDNSGKEHIYEFVVHIEKIEFSEIIAEPEKEIYYDEEVTLRLPQEYDIYWWSTGDTTKEIKVSEPGRYIVTYSNDIGCSFTDSIDIVFKKDDGFIFIGSRKMCPGQEQPLGVEDIYSDYLWSTGDTTNQIMINSEGQYWLEVRTNSGGILRDTFIVSYYPLLNARLKPVPNTICSGDSLLLESSRVVSFYEYSWNTGATTKSIYVSESGTYKLRILDTRTGCVDSTEITINVEDDLEPTIVGNNICNGETAVLEAIPNDPSYEYEWSNGETSPVIEVTDPGNYSVTLRKGKCIGSAEYKVNVYPNPQFDILGENIICGLSAALSASKDFTEYLWSTNETTKEIEVKEPGTYSLTVFNEEGCSSTEEFTVNEQSLSFDIRNDRIDFGKVYINDTRRDSAKIINMSGFDIVITDEGENYTILAGQTVQYNKTLAPTELGTYTDSFEYRVISPCDTVITIPVTAEVYARVEISTKEKIETEIGEEISIPVYLESEADLSEQTYSITTELDQSVLYTEDSFIINKTAPIDEAKTKIHEITGMIMLTSDLEYDITFPSFEFNNQYIEVVADSGKIIIDSVCAFPHRSVLLTEATEMKVSPNPAKDKMEVDIFADVSELLNLPEMKLELISSEGRVVYTENWTQTTSDKQLNVNTDKISSGLYQVRLRTPNGVLTENVIVIK